MVPDLPYVRKDVPGGSGAEGFARWGRSVRTPVRPASSRFLARLRAGGVEHGRERREFRGGWQAPVLGALLASALGLALVAPYAAADPLTDRREQVKHQIAQTRVDLDESSKALQTAAAAVQWTQIQLAAARAKLARTKRELNAAAAADRAMAAKLKKAKAELAAARAAVLAGQRRLDAARAQAGALARDQIQQQNNLLPIAAIVGASSPVDLQTRLQWSTTMFDTAAAGIDDLEAIQAQLTAERARQAELEAQVAVDRQAAADALTTKKRLEQQAAEGEAAVQGLLKQRRAIERSAAAAVAQDRARYAALKREESAVERRIVARIAAARAAARAAAARQAAAERAAHARAVAKARAAAKKAHKRYKAPKRISTDRASHKASHGVRRSGPARSSLGAGYAGHGFSIPVAGPITSPYGMRFHPVLHVWKLHDGTDFAAGCGAAIRAPYAGRVAERYYNAGYGNRLMIDHGYVDGRYVTSGYNHAISYIVGVGQQVSRGQVIGYVGDTGYATGCHLHLMVWLNGGRVNPMSWF